MIPELPFFLYCKFNTVFSLLLPSSFRENLGKSRSSAPSFPVTFPWEGRSCCPSHIPLHAFYTHTPVPHLPLYSTCFPCTTLLLYTIFLPCHMSSHIFPVWILPFPFWFFLALWPFPSSLSTSLVPTGFAHTLMCPLAPCHTCPRALTALQGHIQAASGTHSPSALVARGTRLSRNQSILQEVSKACKS